MTQTNTDRSASYHSAFPLGVQAAQHEQQPQLTGNDLLFLAVRDYHHASETLNLTLDDFLLGWCAGWDGYYDGIIGENDGTNTTTN